MTDLNSVNMVWPKYSIMCLSVLQYIGTGILFLLAFNITSVMCYGSKLLHLFSYRRGVGNLESEMQRLTTQRLFTVCVS